MSLPPPTEKQTRIIWMAVTGLAIGIIVALVVALVWGLGEVLNVLSPVIWPIAVAAVLACLLDPVVGFLERRRVPRMRAVAVVFVLALLIVPVTRSSLNARDLSAYLRDAADGMSNTATLIGDSREGLASRLRVELRHFLDVANG